MAQKTFRKGDAVKWSTSQGETRGKVVKKLTSTTNVSNEPSQKGTTVKATKDDPYYLVESNKTGKRAAHKPESLKKA